MRLRSLANHLILYTICDLTWITILLYHLSPYDMIVFTLMSSTINYWHMNASSDSLATHKSSISMVVVPHGTYRVFHRKKNSLRRIMEMEISKTKKAEEEIYEFSAKFVANQPIQQINALKFVIYFKEKVST